MIIINVKTGRVFTSGATYDKYIKQVKDFCKNLVTAPFEKIDTLEMFDEAGNHFKFKRNT